MVCEMKDFSKIKAGDTLILRNGGREVCTEVTDRWFAADCFSWKKSGDYFEYKKSNFDIIDYEQAPEKKEYTQWVVWFRSTSGKICQAIYEELDIARLDKSTEMWERIAITPVTFKEGDGL